MAEAQRVTAYFSGSVQGVGFRYTAVALARNYPAVTGYIRNLPDGRVELLAEGAKSDLDALLAALRSEMAPYVRDVEFRPGKPTGGFARFQIRR